MCYRAKMPHWLIVCGLLMLVSARSSREDEDRCGKHKCVGEGYECIDGRCYCANGYVSNQHRCLRCPGFGEKCFGLCCDGPGNQTLQCWQGVCLPCYDHMGEWICREPLDHILLVSSTQVVMGGALVLGIIATFVLLYKLCATTSLRPLGSRPSEDGRLSIGSLQVYIEERLRDAPPRYSRTPAAGSATYPAISYLNAGFVHDSSIPPPPYVPEASKTEETTQNTALHI